MNQMESDLTQAELLRLSLLRIARMGGDVEAVVREALRGIPDEIVSRIVHNAHAVLLELVARQNALDGRAPKRLT